MAKVIIEKVNTNELEVLGKTIDSASYSGDAGSREKIKRCFLTTEEVDESMTVRGEGKDTIIRKVEKADKVEVGVQLLNAENIDDGKSLATAILKDVYTAPSKENEGLTEIFVKSGTNCQALSEIREIADSLSTTDTGARALGKWYPAVNGKRVIIRVFADIDKKGKVTGSSNGCCEDDCCCD